MIRILTLAAMLAIAASGAPPLLSPVFADGMVLQRAPATPSLHGRTEHPGQQVELSLDGNRVAAGVSDAHGRWELRLPATEASGVEHTVAVSSDGETATIKRVLFGDLFLCAGDRAMASPMAASNMIEKDGMGTHTLLRLARRAEHGSHDSHHVMVSWDDDAPDVAARFSELCYRFGVRALSKDVPVGLVDASVEKGRFVEVDCSPLAGARYHEVLRPMLRLEMSGALWSHSASKGHSDCYAPFVARVWGRRVERAAGSNPFIRDPDTPPLVIGHRGGGAYAPENTMASQEVCRRGGTEWIEDDTQPSSDKVPFVLHDDTVDRTTDGSGPIRNITAADLKKLDAGSWFSPVFTGTRLPTLQEQLEDLHKKGGNLLLEIKGEHSRDEVARIVKTVRDTGMASRVFVMSFIDSAVSYANELAPELPRAVLRSILDINPVKTAQQLNATGYNPDWKNLLLRPDVVAELHKADKSVFVWTPDTPSAWQQLWDIGVDAIITNRPTELQGYIAGRTAASAARATVGAQVPLLLAQSSRVAVRIPKAKAVAGRNALEIAANAVNMHYSRQL